MSRVTIFGDESGTMPADDSDAPFCIAALATLGQLPTLKVRSGHRRDILRACVAVGGVWQIVFVRASPGYGQELRAKTSKMSTMARASRLVTGAHEYLPDRGYGARNMIWIRSMAVGMARVAVKAVSPEAIREVIVALDRKTIASRERALFTDRLRSQSRDILGKSSNTYEVKVYWSDAADASLFQDGLFLAHHLSRLAREALEAGSEEALAPELGVPPSDMFYDATSDVVAPLPRWSIENWKRRTGLPEPSE